MKKNEKKIDWCVLKGIFSIRYQIRRTMSVALFNLAFKIVFVSSSRFILIDGGSINSN